VADAMEAAEQLNPLREGVVHMQDPPVAESRDGHGAYMITESAGTAFGLRHPGLFSSKRAFDSLGAHAIDFERKQKHYAFGGGQHTGLGSHLARLEMRVVLEEWPRRSPDYRLRPGGSDRVEWPAGLTGIDRLPLVLPPGGGPA
jgi:hypothetical protein